MRSSRTRARVGCHGRFTVRRRDVGGGSAPRFIVHGGVLRAALLNNES